MTHIDRVLRSNLKLKHLQLLVALDEFRHLGKAAEFLAVTQPAVSKSLAEIERMVGFSLFERSTRGTIPTPFGESLIRFARSVLAGYERTRDEIAAVASGAAGRVSVGAMVVATPVLLTRAVELLKERSAQTRVLVEEGDLTRLLPKVRLGELDLFVGRLEPGYAAPDLEAEPLYNEPMTAVARPEDPLVRKKSVGWADVAAAPVVLPPPWASLRVKLDQLLVQHGLGSPADVIETASFLATMAFVRQRGAVAFLAQSVARHFEREGAIRILPLRIKLDLPQVGIITMRGQRKTVTTEAMIDCLRRASRAEHR